MPQSQASLDRFVEAQEPVFQAAIEEIREGRKRNHWMWFVFPQMRGLGHSLMAERYGIESRQEAAAYLAHPVLGPRLVLAAQAVLDLERCSLHEIFGSPDDLKFCSSMTLFAQAAPAADSVFAKTLDRFCGGRADPATLAILRDQEGDSGSMEQRRG